MKHQKKWHGSMQTPWNQEKKGEKEKKNEKKMTERTRYKKADVLRNIDLVKKVIRKHILIF